MHRKYVITDTRRVWIATGKPIPLAAPGAWRLYPKCPNFLQPWARALSSVCLWLGGKISTETTHNANYTPSILKTP